MNGCSTENMLIDRSFQGLTIPLLIPPLPLLVILPSHDHYPFHHVYLDLLLFAFVHRPLSLKHDDDNGEGNSSKKNSLKTRLKELVKIPSSSSQLTLGIESMIQQSSKGVMLQIFLFLFTQYTYQSPMQTFPFLIVSHMYALPPPSPCYMFHPLTQLFITHITYALPTP